jgi:ribulose bisphosphate carboxylase small subunit
MKITTTGLLLAVSAILLLSITNSSNAFAGTVKDRKSVATISSINSFSTIYANEVYQNILHKGYNLSQEVFNMAFKGFEKLSSIGKLNSDSLITIIDFTKSSKEKRMFVVDLKRKQVVFNTVVSHGMKSGAEFARSFSNKMNSHQSSIGFYITGNPYKGSNGYSLKLDGIEQGFNDRAMERAIVMHGAPYANERMIKVKGFLGRSFGCPALPQQINKQVINTIKQGNMLFVYYPDQKYLKESEILNG